MHIDLENYDFKSYLIEIGFKEKYARMVSVVEILKEEIKDIKEDDEFRLTKEGIYNRNGLIKIIDDRLRIAKGKFFQEKEGMLTYIEDDFTSLKISIINDYGVIDKVIISKKPPYHDTYESYERMEKDGVPYIEVVKAFGKDNIRNEIREDYGDPINLSSSSKKFVTNYNKYVRHYPELEEWYEKRYSIKNAKGAKEYSENIHDKQCDIEIKLLTEEVNRFNQYIKEAKDKKKEYNRKLEEEIAALKKKKRWSIRKITYSNALKIMQEDFNKIDSRTNYKFNSTDKKVRIDHEKTDKDHTEPLTYKEKEVEKLKNKIIDKRLELQKIENDIGKLMDKIEVVKKNAANASW